RDRPRSIHGDGSEGDGEQRKVGRVEAQGTKVGLVPKHGRCEGYTFAPKRASVPRGSPNAGHRSPFAVGLALLSSACAASIVPPAVEPRPAEAIVVLGNRPPVLPDGSIAPETARRVRRGVALYERGLAPVLVM